MMKPLANPLAIWNAVLALAVTIAVVALGLYLFLPKPQPRLSTAVRVEREKKALAAIEKLTESRDASRATIARLVWTEDADSVQSKAMALASRLAKASKISLNAFRPQKVVEEDGLQRLPFTLSLEGPYPNVADFLRKLETTENRLAVNLVQLTSADGATDTVTGTVGVIAFREAKSPMDRTPVAGGGRASGGT